MHEPMEPEFETETTPAAAESGEFAQMLEQSLQPSAEPSLKPGDKVRGKIVMISADEAFVDIGGRSEGVLSLSEIRDDAGAVKHQVGDTIEAAVASVDGAVTLTMALRKDKVNTDALRQAMDAGLPVEGHVKSVNAGGFEVRVGALRGFCPFSQMDLHPVGDGAAWVNKTLPFKVIEIGEGGKRIVLSRRALIEAERRGQAQGLRDSLAVGQELDGTVTRLAPFGAFVELGGVEGLVHISQLSNARVKEVSEAVHPGQKVRVRVVKLEKVGQSGERISLSMKALQESPWATLPERVHEGDVLQGTVVRLADFGAFVEVLPGIDGLVHVSQVSRRRVAHPRDALTVGQQVAVKVLKIDPAAKRLSLSIRDADAGVVDAPPVEAGQVYEGIVAGIKPYGVFVDLPSGQTGLLPRIEMSVPRGADLAKFFKEGDTLQVGVLSLEADGKIRLSTKTAEERAEMQNVAEYQAAAARPARPAAPRQDGGREGGGRTGGGRESGGRDGGGRDRGGRGGDRDRDFGGPMPAQTHTPNNAFADAMRRAEEQQKDK